jgi:hypothetical protein
MGRVERLRHPVRPVSSHAKAALLREFHSIFQAVAVFALLTLSEAVMIRAVGVRKWIRGEPRWASLFLASLLLYLAT